MRLRPTLTAVLLFAVGISVQIRAQQITLNPSDRQSFIASKYYAYSGTVTQATANVDALPYATPQSMTLGSFTSIVIPSLTDSSLAFTYSETNVGTGATDSVGGSIFFVPQTNLTYSLAGTLTTTSGEGSFFVDLIDRTQNTVPVYDYNPTTVGTESLSGQEGLTGTLTAGHIYQFDAYESEISTSISRPMLTGNVALTLVDVPEPATWTLALSLFASVALIHAFPWTPARFPASKFLIIA